MSSTIANGYGTGYTAPADSDPIWAHGTGFDPDLNTQVLTGEAAIQADTLDIAQNYVNADTANRERLVRAILGDAATKVAIDDLVAIETLIQNTLNEAFTKDSAHAPVFKVVDHGDVDQTDLPEGADDTFLSEGVEGAFITPEESGTDGGIILLSRDLLADPERLGEVALEELGEALVVHVQKDDTWDFVAEKYEGDDDVDFDVEEGDVGARIASTIQEERIEKHTWYDSDSDSDLTSVMWMGSKTDAIAAEADTPTNAELAAEWDVTEAEAAAAMGIAEENLARKETEFLFADDPDVDNEAEWGRFVSIYGNGNKIGVYGLARAIIDGAMKTADNNVQDGAFAGVDLTQVSNHTLTDKIWTHAEESVNDGAERSQISLTMLADAVSYVTGDVDAFRDNGVYFEFIQDNFADITENGETRLSGAEGPTRFSKDAIQSIWDSGAFTPTDYENNDPGVFEFAVNTAAEATEATDPDDPGLIGQDHSAFGNPEGAENISMHFVDGDDTYHGFDVLYQRYTLPTEPDVTFYTKMHAEEGEDFLVVEALKVNEETGDIQIFDSEGTETFTGNRSDFAPETKTLTVEEILHDGSDAEAELIEWAGDDLLYSAATSQVSYVLYSDPDRAIDEYTDADTTVDNLMIRYVVPTYDEATGTMIYSEPRSVEADSPEGKNIITAAEYAGKADLLAQEVEADETGEGVSDTVVFDIDTTDVDPDTGQVAMADSVVMGASAAAGAQQSDAAVAAAAFFVPEIIVPVAIGAAAFGGWKASHQYTEWQMNRQSGKVHVIEATMNAEDAPGGSGGGASADTTHTPNTQRGPTVGTVRKMPPGQGSGGDDPVPPPGGTTVKTHYIEMPDTLEAQLQKLDDIVAPAGDRLFEAVLTFNRFRESLADFIEFRQTGQIVGRVDATLATVRADLMHRADQFHGTANQPGPMALLYETMRDLRTLDGDLDESLSTWFQQNLLNGGLTPRGIEQMRRVITLVRDVGTLETGITATNGRMMDIWEPFTTNWTGTDIPDAALATVRTALDTVRPTVLEPALANGNFWVRIAAGIEAMRANPEAHRLGEEGEI